MVGIGTLKYYNNLYRLRRKGLQFSKAFQTKLYNWFPPFFEQNLWLPKFIEGRGLLKDKPGLKAGVFTICGPEWAIKYQPCDLKIFFARENLSFRKEWHDFMLNEPSIDLSIGFDDITDHANYLHIPFWITWALDPMESEESIKRKIAIWNAPESKSYKNRKFCSMSIGLVLSLRMVNNGFMM